MITPISKADYTDFGYWSRAWKRIGVSEIKVYDISGRQVRRFSLEPRHLQLTIEVCWNGRDKNGKKLPSGIYYIMVDLDGKTLTEKILHIR